MRRFRLLGACLSLVAVLWCAGVASAASSKWIAWRPVATVGVGLSGISCPSSSLCVASGANGSVATSIAPTSGRSTWTLADVDGSDYLTAVACPTPQMCIAMDPVGHVALSSNPSGGPGTWALASAPSGATSLSCPTAGFCAAAAAGYVYVTSDPAGGASGWTAAAGGDQGPECGKYGGTSDCLPASMVVSCPSIAFCAAGDSYGLSISTTDPLGGSTAWQGGGPSAGEYDALSCPSGSLCVGSCPPGFGFNGQDCAGNSYGAGTIVSWNPAAWQVSSPGRAQFAQISTQQLTGVWCQTNSLCFATDRNLLYATVDPTGGPSAWETIAGSASVDGVSCPSPTRCLAVTSAGTILLGSPPPTRRQILSLLRAEIPSQHHLRAAVLLRDGGYSFSFNAPTAGRLHIAWYPPEHGHRGSGVLVASASHHYAGATTDTLTVRLTPAGRRILRTTPAVSLVVRAAFDEPGTAITTESPITLS